MDSSGKNKAKQRYEQAKPPCIYMYIKPLPVEEPLHAIPRIRQLPQTAKTPSSSKQSR